MHRAHYFGVSSSLPSKRYRRASVVYLVYTVGVILWGALVRATLSGDGCGDHWPLCNGEVVPLAPSIETMIELTHRVTSGVAWIVALAFWWVARRIDAPLVRRGAGWSLVFMTTEALVGAGLVIFRMVADNPDTARGYWAAAHLTNTLLLLGALTLHVYWSHGGRALRMQRRTWVFGAVLLGWMLLGASGAIAALGDTLFPSSSLAEGVAADFSASSHLFLRLRTLHPILALGVGAGTLYLIGQEIGRQRRLAFTVGALLVAQVGLGFLNVLLLAPIWLQLVHLLVADVLWVGLCWLASVSLAAAPELTHSAASVMSESKPRA